jgi:acetate kinase
MNEKKNVLVINCGSTSTKYKFFNFKGEEIFFESFKLKEEKDKKKEETFLKKIKKITKKEGLKIAFRVVHGGDLAGPVVLDNEVEKKIKNFTVFAPIHNKVFIKKLAKIKKIFEKSYEEKSFFAVFDTDFHKTIPEEFSTYPIDQQIAQKFKIKKYGFHGIAVESALSKISDNENKKIILAHLGGGSSLTAVEDGKSVLNSMGLTPISGLMMATRIGDADSDLDKILAQKMGKTVSIVSDIFSRKSGFLGLTGSIDIKEIFKKAQIEMEKKEGEFKKEKLAFDIFLNQVVQKIGAYHAVLGGTDILAFSGGIGEGNSFFRKEVLKKVEHMGINKEKTVVIEVDEEKTIFEKVENI